MVKTFLSHLSLLILLFATCRNSLAQNSEPDWRIKGALSAIQDSSPGIRAKAVNRLLDLHWYNFDRKTIDGLSSTDNEEAKQAATLASAAIKTIDVRVLLRAAANKSKENPAARCTALRALGYVGGKDADDQLYEALANPGPQEIGDCASFSAEQAFTVYKPISLVPRLTAVLNRKPPKQKLAKSECNSFTVKNLQPGVGNAAVALGQIGDPSAVPALLAHAADPTNYTVSPFLESIGEIAAQHPPDKNTTAAIQRLLENPDPSIRAGAVFALASVKEPSPEVRGVIARLRSDKSDAVVGEVYFALGKFGMIAYKNELLEAAKKTAPGTESESKQAGAIKGLAALHVVGACGFIADQLQSFGFQIPDAALTALIDLKCTDTIPKIVESLKQPTTYYRNNLSDIRPWSEKEILQLLSYVYQDRSRSDDIRSIAYFVGGGEVAKNDLITFLGYPRGSPANALTRDEGRRILQNFQNVWKISKEFPELQEDLEKQIALVTRAVGFGWTEADVPLLSQMAKDLESVKSTESSAVLEVIKSIEVKKWGTRIALGLATQFLFWVAFVVLYTRSPKVRAIFFWNKWVRRIAGLGYVEFLLTWIPPLRRRLMQPFRDTLAEDAGQLKMGKYFAESSVRNEEAKIKPIIKALPRISGRVLLEGDSGLGKTMFLRWLILNSKKPVVFLPARKCRAGVVEAIQEKLAGPAGDANFLRSLVYAGGLDVCIDGLNEVSPNTVAQISSFVSTNPHANILIASQPFDWQVPAGVHKFVLLPLSREQILAFLKLRGKSLDAAATVRGAEFEKSCTTFLAQELAPLSAKRNNLAQRVLSNPMDLTIVAHMISWGATPDLYSLQKQQYNLAAADYQKRNPGQKFPLEFFSAAVFKMRMEDRPDIPPDHTAELETLAQHKMVYFRMLLDERRAEITKWYFRHDKMQDFFLLQHFLRHPEEQLERLRDPRFRGVYPLLATFLNYDDAKKLQEFLVEQAAETQDHFVSDTFVKVLRFRIQPGEMLPAGSSIQ